MDKQWYDNNPCHIKQNSKLIGKVCTALLILFCHASFAQSLKKNSIDFNINNAATLEIKVDLLIDAGNKSLENDKSNLAKRYYERAVTDGIKLGKHPSYASALTKLANLQENKITARSLYQNSLDIYEELYGPRDLNNAHVLDDIVWTYDYSGSDTELAIDQIKRSIVIRRYHKDYQTLPANLRTLAWLYEIKNDYKKAETNYREALNIDLRILGFNDIRVILSMENLAQFFIDIGEFKKAEGVLWDKRKRHKAAKYIDYYNLGRSESMLAWVYLKLGKDGTAEYHFINALNNIKESMNDPSDSPSFPALPALLDLIAYYANKQQFDKARIYYDQAQNILSEAGDGSLADHAQFIENEILSGNGASYTWSADYQIDGIRLMIDYALKNN
ncbi:hypothetical protein AwWohl_12520 [Gammaproteobacteria bacterium]|nr:hypothetical protein AwWohl_12520 [Gammaproteobacteria bacterium]